MLTIVFFKTSLVILFYRIFVAKTQRFVLKVVLAVICVYGIFHVFWIIFQCGVPRSAETIIINSSSGRCFSPTASIGINYAHSVVNLAVDLTLVAIAIPNTWKTQLLTREKVVVTVLFGLVLMSVLSMVAI